MTARCRRAGALVALCALALALSWLALASVAQAEPPVNITFEEGLVGETTPLAGQYTAGYGVTWGRSTELGLTPSGGARLHGADCPLDYIVPEGFQSEHSAQGSLCEGGEFATGGMTMAFKTPRPVLTMDVRGSDYAGETDNLTQSSEVDVQGFAADGSQVFEQLIPASLTQPWYPLTITTETPVAYIHLDSLTPRQVPQIDDLHLASSEITSKPFWLLSSEQSEVSVPEGGVGALPLKLAFFNGASGPVTLSPEQAPGGPLTAIVGSTTGNAGAVAFIAPNGTGGDSTTLTVGGSGASAGELASGPVTVRVNVQPALTLTINERQLNAPQGCGPITAAGRLNVVGSYTGLVQITGRVYTGAEGLPVPRSVPLTAASVSTSDVYVTHPGSYPVEPQIVTSAGAPAASYVHFEATPTSGAQPPRLATADLPIDTTPPSASVIGFGSAPEFALPNQARLFPGIPTQIPIRVEHSCPVFTVSVGNEMATVGATLSPLTPSEIIVPVPPLATDGPLTLKTPAGITLKAGNVSVDDLRSKWAFGFENKAWTGGFSWSDMIATFGFGQTNVEIGPITVRNPVAEIWQQVINNFVAEGLCYGIVQEVSRFVLHERYPEKYDPSDIWPHSLDEVPGYDANYPADSSLLGNDLLHEWASQFDSANIEHYAGAFLSQPFEGPTAFVNKVEGDINSDGLVVLAMADVTGLSIPEAHTVLAYGYHPNYDGQGDTAFDVYNPNLPFPYDGYKPAAGGMPVSPEEEVELAPSGLGHATAVAGSVNRVIVTPSGEWKFSHGGGLAHREIVVHEPWSGGLATIYANTMAQRTLNPQLPGAALGVVLIGSVANDLFSSLGGFVGSAPVTPQVAGITVNGRSALKKGLPASGSGVALLPIGTRASQSELYALKPGKRYSVTLDSHRSGSYGYMTMGDGLAGGVVQAHALAGHPDTVTLSPGTPQIGFTGAAAAPVSLALSGGSGKRSDFALVSVSSGAGTTTVSMHGSQIALAHAGKPATVSLALESRGAVVGSAPIAVPAHTSATISVPWGGLAHGSLLITLRGHGHTLHKVAVLSAGRGGKLARLLHRSVKKPKPHHKKRVATSADQSSSGIARLSEDLATGTSASRHVDLLERDILGLGYRLLTQQP